jgi:hypothetical protein
MPRDEPAGKKPCCMISEILEEAGLDRQKARALRRQVLQGIVLMCQWQLERMDRSAAAKPGDAAASPRKARKVSLD